MNRYLTFPDYYYLYHHIKKSYRSFFAVLSISIVIFLTLLFSVSLEQVYQVSGMVHENKIEFAMPLASFEIVQKSQFARIDGVEYEIIQVACQTVELVDREYICIIRIEGTWQLTESSYQTISILLNRKSFWEIIIANWKGEYI